MSPKRKRQLFTAIGIFLSALFLYFCFRSLDAQALKETFLLPKPWPLIAVVAMNFLVMSGRALVWQLLLNPLGKVRFWMLFDVTHVGTMVNTLLPLKAGEFFRATFISKKHRLPYTQVLTTVGLERYFSGFSLLAILIFLTTYLDFPIWIKTSSYILAACLLGVQIGLLFIWKRKPNLTKWKRHHPAIYRIAEFLFHVGEGSHALRSSSLFAMLILLSLLLWGIQAIMLKSIEHAFGVSLPWTSTFFVLIAINLAIALPSAPGNLGTFEFAAVLAYTWLNVDKAIALGIGFYFHFLPVIPTTAIGLFYYFRWGLRIKDLEEAELKKAEALP